MKTFLYPRATFPSQTVTKNIQWHGLFAAILLTIVVVAQLMTMEQYIPMMAALGSSTGTNVGLILSSASVVLGVFSLPYLMRMALSPLFRAASAVSGVLFCVLWVVLASSTLAARDHTVSAPMLGGLSSYFGYGGILGITVALLLVVSSALWRLKKDVTWK